MQFIQTCPQRREKRNSLPKEQFPEEQFANGTVFQRNSFLEEQFAKGTVFHGNSLPKEHISKGTVCQRNSSIKEQFAKGLRSLSKDYVVCQMTT